MTRKMLERTPLKPPPARGGAPKERRGCGGFGHCMLGEARKKAVVYDVATARTFCGMFTVGIIASPARGGVPQGRRG